MEKDYDLPVAKRGCVMTRSEEDMVVLIAFMSEKLQFMTERG